jgi:hypothetical protein
METKTRERFRDKVGAHGGSAAAAIALGCSRSYVDMIIKGARRPGMQVARAIEGVFGIAMQEWVDWPRAEPKPGGGRWPERPTAPGPHPATGPTPDLSIHRGPALPGLRPGAQRR